MPDKQSIFFPIPMDKIVSPYDGMVSALQMREFEIISLPSVYVNAIEKFTGFSYVNIEEIIKFLAIPHLADWNTILHHVVKLKWNETHTVPGKRNYVQAMKSEGLAFGRLLELCIQCHAMEGYKVAGYPDASEWFKQIGIEWVRNEILFGLTTDFLHPIFLASNIEYSKTTKGDRQRQILRKLRAGKNPCHPTLQTHIYHLMTCSQLLADKSDVFRKDYWNPYLDAYAASILQWERNPKGYHRTHIARLEQRGEKYFYCLYESFAKSKALKLILKIETISKPLALQGLQELN